MSYYEDERKKRLRSYFILVSVIIVFLLFKLSQLLTDIEPFMAYEEITNGCLAHDVAKGNLLMGIFDYQARVYSGGTLISGILTIPFFLLFGHSIISLKLVPLLFGILILALWFNYLRDAFGLRTALFFALFFTFPSNLLCRVQLIAWGNHFESMFFTILTFLTVKKIVETENEAETKNWEWFFILGFISGLGIYFDYIHFITLLALAVIVLIVKRNLFKVKNILIYIPGFILGFSPWIGYRIYKSITEPESPLFFSYQFSKRIDSNFTLSNVLKRIYKITFSDIPASLQYRNINSSITSVSGYLILIISFVFASIFLMKLLRSRNFTVSNLFPVIFPLVFLFMFYFSGFYNYMLPEMEWYFVSKYRYFPPLLPFFYFFISWGTGKYLMDSKKIQAKFLSVIILSSIIFCGFFEGSSYIKPSKYLLGRIYKGYSYWELIPAYLSVPRNETTLNNIVRYLDDGDAAAYFSYIGEKLYGTFENDKDFIQKTASSRTEPLKYSLYTGIGEALYQKIEEYPEKIKDQIERLPEKYKEACYDGYFFAFSMTIPYQPSDDGKQVNWDVKRVLQIIEDINPLYRNAAYRGLGRAIMSREIFYTTSKLLSLEIVMPKCLSALKDVPDEGKDPIIEGYSFTFVSYWLEGMNKFVFMNDFSKNKDIPEMKKIISDNLRKIFLVTKNMEPAAMDSSLRGVADAIEENVTNPDFRNYLLNGFPQRQAEIIRKLLSA